MTSVEKTHISLSGKRVPCTATLRDCPRGGHETVPVGSPNEQAFQAAASRAYQTEYLHPSWRNWNGITYANGPDMERFPLNEATAGQIITDDEHIKRIANNPDGFLSGWETPYLESEQSLYFKKYDEYFTEVAVLGEDSWPILSSSFDILMDKDAHIEKISFLSRFSILKKDFGDKLEPDEVTQGENLYSAFRNHGGNGDSNFWLAINVYTFAQSTGRDPEEYYKRYEATDNSERIRRSGKKSGNPTPEERAFALDVVKEALSK